MRVTSAAWSLSSITSRATSWNPRAEEEIQLPHPAPNSAGNEEETQGRMGATFSVIKTLIVPAIISLILYLIISYLLVPIWKRYRGRYSNYLPLDTISTQTTSWRQKIQSALIGLLIPSRWQEHFNQNRYTVSAEDGGSDFDENEGEELFDVDERRREALSLDARRGRDDDAGLPALFDPATPKHSPTRPATNRDIMKNTTCMGIKLQTPIQELESKPLDQVQIPLRPAQNPTSPTTPPSPSPTQPSNHPPPSTTPPSPPPLAQPKTHKPHPPPAPSLSVPSTHSTVLPPPHPPYKLHTVPAYSPPLQPPALFPPNKAGSNAHTPDTPSPVYIPDSSCAETRSRATG
ncbi:hypothetical protein GLAREA_01031 [Glarea lozoyensis ATCC 20868]|uniref:Uncharacterized protein n=1 Tax=Glarea lozoyensis (strain ATCC 20868 / MF5171) TaxID=1116229 RepID=S3DD06_GLAL2|nr:uncharacterized protein GLAREA_01031 [Glarea lozoyensis ATCC 20868]EPE29871.1 hypothetical protein GLAREA_01031 [Glarea lozoyensis ATCC 20868]